MLSGLVEFAVYFWPITLLLLLHGMAALVLSFQNIRPRHVGDSLLPFIFPFSIILVGHLFWYGGTRASAPKAPVIAANLMFIAQVLISFYLVYRCKGVRWFMTAACLMAIWLGLINLFLVGMALT